MKTKEPTNKELIAALGVLLAEYAELDEMLDSYASTYGMEEKELRRQKANNRSRDKVERIWRRAIEQ